MKLQLRVLLAQLPALVVVVLLVGFGSVTLDRLAGQGRAVLGENYRSVVAAQRMKESIERLDSAALFCLADACDRADPLVAEHQPRFEAELAVEEGNVTEAGEGEAVRTLRADWSIYAESYHAFRAAPPEGARALYFDRLLPQFLAVKEGCDRVLALNQDAMVAKADASEGVARRSRSTWIAGAVLGFAAAVGLGLALAGRLTGPLRQFTAAAERIGEGQLEARLPESAVTELDAVARAFNQMAERLRLYRRAADSELSRTREAAQAAIESLVDPVLVLTVKGEVRATNEAARRVVGIEPRARRLSAGDPALLEAVAGAHAKVVADGRPVLPRDFSTAVLVPGDAGDRAFLAHATPVNDAVTGEMVGVTVLLQDVTRLRHLDELKGNFVHTVAHELRTPLTSLGMALHLALDERVSGPLEPRLLDLLTAARDDTRRLRTLVEDLLDLSRLQAGRTAEVALVPPAELLAEVVDTVRTQADARGATVATEVDDGLAALSVDRTRMRVALVNLATNAIRHSPTGGRVILRAHRVEGRLRLEVDDDGPGVPRADRERIFEPFVRGEGETSEGAGLGLYIAREVVRAHGGHLGVERSPTRGARFWIELPA